MADHEGSLGTETQSSVDRVPSAPAPPFRPGDAAGRYTFLWPLGEGGMGQVHAAYDRQLDRKVALKLLHPRRAGLADGAGLLLREAQSMARLRHPNVVTVHDVGTLDERVFVSMELVEGSSLRAWLAEKKPGWREVLVVFIAAGRGLAAAHRNGLVHRDFKPENVLIDRDGWVRVADFGLARPAETGGAVSGPPPAPDESFITPAAGGSDTRSSLMAGTPRYMAPEQRAGHAAEPRSDQFAFCVALHEALFGEHPFADGGALRAAPRQTTVPAWVRAVVARGLATDSAARWPSMDALLAALGDDPGVVRRRWLGGGAAAIALAVLIWSATRGQAAPCSGAEQTFGAIWDAPRRGQIREAFERSGRPFAADTYATVVGSLDARAAALTAVQTESCLATQVRHEQSEDMLDRRTRCVERQRRALVAVIDVLGHADAEVVDSAVNAVGQLDDPAACSDLEALSAVLPLPRDPQLAQRIALIRTTVEQAHLLTLFGRWRPALAFAQTATVLARATGWDPLTAEAAFALGVSRVDGRDAAGAERALFEALHLGLAGHDDDIATRAAARLISVTAEQQRFTDSARWASVAEALLRRAGVPRPQTASDVAFAEALLAKTSGRLADAEEHNERALAIQERLFGPNDPRLGAVLANLSQVYRMNGKGERAREYALRGLAVVRAGYGPRHPVAAAALAGLALVDLELVNLVDAERQMREALAIDEASIGPDAVLTAEVVVELGDVVARAGRDDEALALYRRALSSLVVTYAPSHWRILQVRNRLSALLITGGELDAAGRELEVVVAQLSLKTEPSAIFEALTELASVRLQQQRLADLTATLDHQEAVAARVFGAHHPNVSLLLAWRSDAALLGGHPAEAVQLATRSYAELKAALGDDHPIIASVRCALGQAELAAGMPAEAARDLDAALAQFTRDQRRDTTLAKAQVPLARALWDSGGDRQRAVALARAAAVTLHGRDKPEEKDLALLRVANDAWLAAPARRL